jgi:2-polyprenyl-6-methoxyphenol hydroxylase-like FAD-dependent oxidoreductase
MQGEGSHFAHMDVFVAGGGIAGLTAAIAMAKAGHGVVVVERASELREIGAALSLWPNAFGALDFLGVGERVRAIGLEAPTASVLATTGKPIVRFDTEAMRRALGGLPLIVLRAGLQATLLSECGRLEVEISLGETVEEVRTEGSRVAVTTSRREAVVDAVVGADGINSKVRAAIRSDDDGRRDCDRVVWRALIPAGRAEVSETWLTVGVGLQLIASPAPDELVYWAADTPGRDMPADSTADHRDILRRRFGAWHAPIPQMIDATPPDALIVNRIFDRRPPRALHLGPILLVGDAAHAMTPDLGQGACQAIEDAAVLLACARARPTIHPAGLFDRFESIRGGRVRCVVRDSYALGRLAVTPSRLGAGARDFLTRLLPESMSNRRLASYSSADAFRRQLVQADV